ncbi:hypothetical protein [Paenibacillus tepidiphilus]|uniref:hypothetical protein n=1 Tax=Paenibacillus tepidiphilus TaxID=2608683 RepID=UPI001EF03E8B|nr:hypothetical protein [Paenibacillus tepidiphilus]
MLAMLAFTDSLRSMLYEMKVSEATTRMMMVVKSRISLFARRRVIRSRRGSKIPRNVVLMSSPPDRPVK